MKHLSHFPLIPCAYHVLTMCLACDAVEYSGNQFHTFLNSVYRLEAAPLNNHAVYKYKQHDLRTIYMYWISDTGAGSPGWALSDTLGQQSAWSFGVSSERVEDAPSWIELDNTGETLTFVAAPDVDVVC